MSILTKTLQISGAVCLATIAAGIGFLVYAILTNTPKINVETRSSTAFVFRWSGLDPQQDYQVIESFRSERSFTGDHLDYFCVKLEKFFPDDKHQQDWIPATKLDPTGRDTARQAQEAADAQKCFNRRQISPEDIQAYVWSVTLHTGQITAYDIMLFDQRSGRLLYVSEKT